MNNIWCPFYSSKIKILTGGVSFQRLVLSQALVRHNANIGYWERFLKKILSSNHHCFRDILICLRNGLALSYLFGDTRVLSSYFLHVILLLLASGSTFHTPWGARPSWFGSDCRSGVGLQRTFPGVVIGIIMPFSVSIRNALELLVSNIVVGVSVGSWSVDSFFSGD